MKANLHPQWFEDAKVTCACGETFITGSTVQAMRVDICSKCHPLYTGKQKLVDTMGQVQRFEQKNQKAAEKQKVIKAILETRASKVQKEKTEKPSLKDLLMQARKSAAS
jgi:large subunit ribosomal protein L31